MLRVVQSHIFYMVSPWSSLLMAVQDVIGHSPKVAAGGGLSSQPWVDLEQV